MRGIFHAWVQDSSMYKNSISIIRVMNVEQRHSRTKRNSHREFRTGSRRFDDTSVIGAVMLSQMQRHRKEAKTVRLGLSAVATATLFVVHCWCSLIQVSAARSHVSYSDCPNVPDVSGKNSPPNCAEQGKRIPCTLRYPLRTTVSDTFTVQSIR